MIQVVKEKAGDYYSFVTEITGRVKARMGEEYTVQVHKITKNNSLELDSMVLLKKGKSFAPNIYLEPYYQSYQEGTGIEELSDRLCSIYQNCTTPFVDEKFTYTFDEMKNSIIFRLVSFERNEKLLEKIPYIKYLDLAITFHCLVRDDGEGIGTIRITNEHMEGWKTTLQKIFALSIHNTKKLFPPTLRRMEEVISGILSNEWMGKGEVFPEQGNSFSDNSASSKQDQMYILTNQKGINGASCLLYDNILIGFANQINSDFYILPSSIHEVILVPVEKNMSKEVLTAMVRDVNRTQVACDEVLSDRVYYFSRESNTIIL